MQHGKADVAIAALASSWMDADGTILARFWTTYTRASWRVEIVSSLLPSRPVDFVEALRCALEDWFYDQLD